MAHVMTKRGSQDNVITYEHYCDTTADLQDIPKDQITLGSIAIVIEGDSGGMEAYIANSKKKWGVLMGSNNNGQISLSDIIHICNIREYDKDTRVPVISEPKEGTFYLVPAREDEHDLFEEWVYIDGQWEHFGAGGTVEIPQSDWDQTDSEATNYIKNKPAIKRGGVPDAIIEGSGTVATGAQAHAEGANTTASGAQAHAEGANTTAAGTKSHAEGVGTIASHKSQHVFGEYNIADPSSNENSEHGNYIEIVGNGESDNRSNARTLDWEGNEEIAGNLKVGNNLTIGSMTITSSTVQPDWNESNTSNSNYIKNKPIVKTQQVLINDPEALSETSTTFISNISQNANGEIQAIKKTLPTQEQADWNTTDPSSNDYIRNKPDVKLKQAAVPDPEASTETSMTFIDSVTQDENGVITATKKTLATRVQADWSQTSLVAPDYIKHKPTVKTIQATVADPTALDETSTTFISNISQNGNGVITATKKKVVAQVQADWMQTSTIAPDYIRHKPTVKTIQATVGDPMALDETSTTFISNISQNGNGVITPTKKKLPPIPDLSQSLTVGSTTVTEAQLQALLALLET